MAKNKYIATHEGIEFRRNSDRIYTHCVIEFGLLSEDRASAARAAAYDYKLNHEYHLAIVEDRCPIVARYPTHYPPERLEKLKAEAAEWLAKGKDGLIEEALHRFDERNAGRPEKYWVCIGWCGRPDLAQKLAARSARTVILEAVVI